jgi:anti-anti-sigma factor
LDGSSVSTVRDNLRAAIDESSGDVVLDLEAVEWVDATGLALLVAAHRRLRDQRRRLVLRGCQPGVRRALAVTRLTRVLTLE